MGVNSQPLPFPVKYCADNEGYCCIYYAREYSRTGAGLHELTGED